MTQEEFEAAQQEAAVLAEERSQKAMDWLMLKAEESDDDGCIRLVPKKKGLFGMFRRN